MTSERLQELARGWRPDAEWLACGPRLFAAPPQREAWVRAVAHLLRAHPALRAGLEREATPTPVRSEPSGWGEPTQWTRCLPAAALLALVDGDADRLEATWGRVPSVVGLAEWVPPHHHHSRPLDLSAAAVVAHLALYLDLGRGALAADRRQLLARTIAERGVRPFVEMCRERRAFWTRDRHNWPTVIAGEVGLGLLAAWESIPDASHALAQVVERIATPLASYPPDGSYEEGPGYWHYGLGECLPFCHALRLASGGALDLFALPFLQRTGDYGLHVRTPDGGCFAVEDSDGPWRAGWMLAVLGAGAGRPDWLAAAAPYVGTEAGGPALRQALYAVGLAVPAAGVPAAAPPAPGAPPAARGDGPPAVAATRPRTMAFFPGTQNAMLRSDWGPGAFFAGLHAGSTTVNHAHLDLGTFTLVAAGARVVGDAGSWPYTLDYFDARPGGKRWDYEPNATAGHNALCVDDAGQEPADSARSTFHQIDLRPDEGLALLAVDLAPAYGGRLARFLRHFAYFAEGLLVVADEVWAAGEGGRRLTWVLHPGGEPERLGAAEPEPVPGWRWVVGQAAAEVRLWELSPADGFVLAETRQLTRYTDRVGRVQERRTVRLTAAPLHRALSWRLAAAITAGPADAPPPARAAPAGHGALAVESAHRRGTLRWADGRLAWYPG